MTQITGPIIAITLVLLSVFVPVAFIPGIVGKLYQQFAVAVSVSMLISALNALTLSPALCALLLRHGAPPGRVIRAMQGGIDRMQNGYAGVVARIAPRVLLTLALVGVAVGLTLWFGRLVPAGFLPEEDQGAFLIEAQLPEGASINRTAAVAGEVERLTKAVPGVAGVTSIVGFSVVDGIAQSNKATFFVTLTPFAERSSKAESVWGILDRLRGQFAQLPAAIVIPFNLPPIIGLGTGAGFEYQLQSFSGAPAGEMAAVARGLVQAANANPALAGVFTTYGASTPLIRLDIDRERAATLGIGINDIFTALQAALGGYYVNDFNKFGRTWQVMLQAETTQRMHVDDIFEVHVRAANGALVPLRTLATIKTVLGPGYIYRYDNLRAVTIQGRPAAGYSSGQALAAMEQVSKATLPPGFGFSWSGTAYQEKIAGSQTGMILGLAVLFAYLVLVGLYEIMVDAGRGHRLDRDRAGRGIGRPARDRAAERRVCPDRHRRADRARRQERDPDRRICDAGAARRARRRRRRALRRAGAVPRGDDDLVRVHPRLGAAVDRRRRRGRDPARGRHLGVFRHAGRLGLRDLPDPRPLRRLPAPARRGQRAPVRHAASRRSYRRADQDRGGVALTAGS